MPPKAIIETNASSIIDLKALLSEQKEQFDRQRTGKQPKPSLTKKSQPSKKNRGVETRAQRDIVSKGESDHLDEVEKSRAALERKAKIYETLQRQSHLNDGRDLESNDFLVDFDQKYMEQSKLDRYVSDDDSSDNERHRNREDRDPWVEYEDEFGRTRVVRQSTLARQPRPLSPGLDPEYEDTLRPDTIELADRTRIRHYDASNEIRTKGTGHYTFAADEEERQKQMAELNALRQETEKARKHSRTAFERRKAIIAKRAEHIHQRRAALREREEQIQASVSPTPAVNEDSVTQLLLTMRQRVEKAKQ